MDNIVYLSEIKQHSSAKFSYYVNLVFDTIYFLRKNYPNFKEWYYKKVIPDVEVGKREIILKIINDKISAVSILKRSEEKKICTFVVLSGYRNKGIGKEMLKRSIQFLGTNNPMITVSSDSINEFKHLLNEFGFEEFQNLGDYYRDGVSEHVFNGYLEIKRCNKSFAA